LSNDYSKNILRHLTNLGHEIGLHFDETIYAINNPNDLVFYAMDELKQLSMITQKNIDVISMHRPSKVILNLNIQFPKNVINTYSNLFFNKVKYISDSRMNWHENPIDVVSSDIYKKIQILIHPFWYYDKNLTKSMIIKDFILKKMMRIPCDFNNNFSNLEEILTLSNIKVDLN
jgi:hypothetical protein